MSEPDPWRTIVVSLHVGGDVIPIEMPWIRAIMFEWSLPAWLQSTVLS